MKWWRIRKRNADLERELQSDLLLEEEQRDRSLSPKEARYSALPSLGNPALIPEQTRVVWSRSWRESLSLDLRFSLRTLRRTPGFTVIAILVMVMGIGANVALFTVVRSVLLKPLPFQDPDRLVMLSEWDLHENDNQGYNVVAAVMYAEWKKQNQSFSNLALARGSRVGLSGSGGQLPERLSSAEFSWDLLRTLVIRSRLDVEQYARPVERIVSTMDPGLPVSDVLTMDQLLGKHTFDQSFNATLLTAFAMLSLLLAALGLIGVISYIAAQRTTEIDIRIALGAKRAQVMRKMLLEGIGPAALGLVAVLAASMGAGRLLRGLLYEIKPLDPAVFSAVAAVLLSVAAFACIVPAWRASIRCGH
jgi:hypothetical protein